MIGTLVIPRVAAVAFFAAMVLFAPSSRADPVRLTPTEQPQIDLMHQPEDWFIAHLKGPRETNGGAILDARLQYVLENVTRPASVPAVQTYLRGTYATPEGRAAARTALDRYWLIHTAASAEMKSVEDTVIKGRDGNDIPLRIYHPDVTDKTLPVLVYYHGGGFMFGSIDGWDRTARQLANDSKVIVVSVGYRLAPENPYPAAWNDAEDAFGWTVAHAKDIGGSKVALGGDSAGGTLAIAVALRAIKAHQTAPAALLLYYPGVDRLGDYPSLHQLGAGYGLDKDNLDYLAGLVYPAGVATTSEDTSPVQADLCALPPLVLATAGFDPLKDSQAAFRVRVDMSDAARASNRYFHYSTLIHGFQQTTDYVPDAAGAMLESAQAFREILTVEKPSHICK